MSVSIFSYLRNADNDANGQPIRPPVTVTCGPLHNESLIVLVLGAAPLTLSCQIQPNQINGTPHILIFKFDRVRPVNEFKMNALDAKRSLDPVRLSLGETQFIPFVTQFKTKAGQPC